MYVPSAFSEERVEVLHDLIRNHSFATLISTEGSALPVVTHLPLLLDVCAGHPRGVLVGHLARANEHAASLHAGHPSLAIFHGPHAYVSPRWYATTPSVPTWNYAVVHASGTPRVLIEEFEVLDVLRRTTDAFEPTEGGWRMDGLSPTYLRSMANGVVAFELPIDSLVGKFKLSQNRTPADRAGVVAALANGTSEEAATARLMGALANCREISGVSGV